MSKDNDRFLLMSDCPEVQGRWVPKVGDRCIWQGHRGILIPPVDNEVVQIAYQHSEFRGWTTTFVEPTDLIHLPTGDDLWEMLPEGKYDLLDNRNEPAVSNWYLRGVRIGDKSFFGQTRKEALIQGVMYECHGKVWKDKGGWQDV